MAEADRRDYGRRQEVAGLQAGQVKLVLDIEQGNLEVAHGHVGRLVAEKLHEDRQTHSGAEHLRSKGMPKLVRDNASLNADCSGNLMQRNAQFAAERHAATRAGQKKAVGGARSWQRSGRRRSTIWQTKESTGTRRSVFSLPRGT